MVKTLKKVFRLIGCKTGMWHSVKWEKEGLRCRHCGYFKSKAEHMADMHAGASW